MSGEPTPRTDGMLENVQPVSWQFVHFARQLERELIATRKELDELKDELHQAAIERSLNE